MRTSRCPGRRLRLTAEDLHHQRAYADVIVVYAKIDRGDGALAGRSDLRLRR
jgi:hypothetical protein